MLEWEWENSFFSAPAARYTIFTLHTCRLYKSLTFFFLLSLPSRSYPFIFFLFIQGESVRVIGNITAVWPKRKEKSLRFFDWNSKKLRWKTVENFSGKKNFPTWQKRKFFFLKKKGRKNSLPETVEEPPEKSLKL